MEVLAIIASAGAIAASLFVTVRFFVKSGRHGNDARSVADQRIHQLEAALDQVRHADPSRIVTFRSKIDKAERLMHEVAMH